jgi:phenylacetate-CoA ligase
MVLSELAMRAYNASPTPCRSAMASTRGFYLRLWRYGHDTERLVEEALERETWSEARWRSWQQERLAFVLNRAATRVPFYRGHWSERRCKGDRASWEYLENWPVLEKENVRRHPRAFVAEDCSPRRMFSEHTSGTTGKPLQLWWSAATVRYWYALMEARWRRWHGVSRQDRWAILGGQLVTPVKQRTAPFWVWNAALRQLYMSSYHLAPASIPAYLNALVRYRVSYLWGYSSALSTLAHGAIRLGRRDLKLQVVITNAEPLVEPQRIAISEAFQCPVRETYGMCEITTAAGECEAGTMHLWPEVGIVELSAAPTTAVGPARELICTGLVNADMPLVRYRLGDRGGPIRWKQTICECGRSLPELCSIDGRMDDVLYSRDGRVIGRLDPVFKSSLPVEEAQIIQDNLDRVRVLCVPAPGFSNATAREIASRLRDRMGPIEVVIEQVRSIPRSANGKLRSVISNVRPEEHALAASEQLCVSEF